MLHHQTTKWWLAPTSFLLDILSIFQYTKPQTHIIEPIKHWIKLDHHVKWRHPLSNVCEVTSGHYWQPLPPSCTVIVFLKHWDVKSKLSAVSSIGSFKQVWGSALLKIFIVILIFSSSSWPTVKGHQHHLIVPFSEWAAAAQGVEVKPHLFVMSQRFPTYLGISFTFLSYLIL